MADDEIRAHFDDLRAEDRARLPDSSAMLRNPQTPRPMSAIRSRRAAAWWAAAAGVAAALTLFAVRRTNRAAPTQDAVLSDTAMLHRLTAWQAPTDGLLHLPSPIVLEMRNRK